VSSDNANDLKVVEDVNILPKITRIIENTLVDSGTSVIDEVNISSDSTGDDVNEIIEFNISVVLSKSFEIPCIDYGFMIVHAELSSSESSEFLAIIESMISGFLLLLVA